MALLFGPRQSLESRPNLQLECAQLRLPLGAAQQPIRTRPLEQLQQRIQRRIQRRRFKLRFEEWLAKSFRTSLRD